jgi:hypothetical protein
MLRAIAFVGLITSAFAGEPLNLLVNASAGFSAAIVQQLAVVQSDPSPGEFAEKTVAYAKAKAAYFNALRAAMPELENIATGKEPRPRELDQFASNFSVAGEKHEQAAVEATLFFLKQLSFDPDIEKARAEFERAQKVEEKFHKDSMGSTSPAIICRLASCPDRSLKERHRILRETQQIVSARCRQRDSNAGGCPGRARRRALARLSKRYSTTLVPV